jgi:hypothetical protein
MINSLLIQETTNPNSLSDVLHKILTFIYYFDPFHVSCQCSQKNCLGHCLYRMDSFAH